MSDRYLQLAERFVITAEEGSILAAAKRLNLSQPSLTQSIRRIEEIYRCRLFERTKKGVLLTLTGRILYERSRRMLEISNLAREEISDIVAGRAGTLRIAAGSVWCTRYLPGLVSDLQDRFPDVNIELDLSLTHSGLERLHAGTVDLVVGGISGHEMPKFGFTTEALRPLRYTIGCGVDSPLAKARNVSIETVAKLPLVQFHEDDQLMMDVTNTIEREKGVRFRRAVLTKSILVAIEMAIEGPYVVFLAEDIVERFRFAGMRSVDLNETLYEFQTAMFYRDSLRQTEPFRQLLGALRAFRPKVV